MMGVFTGIIQHVGRVISVGRGDAGKRLRIDVGPLSGRLVVGSSVAVDGACLTAAAIDGPSADFDAVPGTLARTTLDALKTGSLVNLEPALSAGDALDGHIVQGHVDGVCEVVRIDKGAGGHVLTARTEAALIDQMVPKGSVALSGVSLTLASADRERFSVALVPTTLARTTLGDLSPGDRLNLETDVLGKYVRRYLSLLAGDGLTMDMLRDAGFA